jgi:hypothetical protein
MRKPASSRPRFCFPLWKIENEYVEVSPERLGNDLISPIPLSKMSDYLRRDFKPIVASVNIRGRIHHKARVYIPKAKKDFSYYVGTSVREENKKTNEFKKSLRLNGRRGLSNRTRIVRYVESLSKTLSYSEGILPEQKCYLWTDFVSPSFSERSEDGFFKTKIDWQRSVDFSRLVIFGAAGAGKTSFLRRLVLERARSIRDGLHDEVPIYVPLRKWNRQGGIRGALFKSLKDSGIESFSAELDNLWSIGKVLFVFDGLDEVVDEEQPELVDQIRLWVSSFESCRFILSTRNFHHSQNFPDFVHWSLNPLPQEQMRDLVSARLEASMREPFWSRISAEPILMPVASNPLVLSFLLARFLRKEVTPHDVSNVFQMLIEAFIDEWDAVRGIVRSRIGWTAPKWRLSLLRLIALHLANTNAHGIKEKDFEQILSGLPDGPSECLKLSILAEHTGLLIPSGLGEWNFSHRSIKEYLLASFLVERLEDPALMAKCASPHGDSHAIWRFICGLTSEPADALKRLGGQTEVPPVNLAAMIADSLSQQIPADKKAVEKSFRKVLSIFIELFSKSMHSTGHVKPPGAKWVLTVGFDNKSKKHGEAIVLLLEAIRRTRDGIASVIVSDMLKQAPDSRIRHCAEAMVIEGRIMTRWSQNHSDWVLSIFIKNSA